VHNMCLVRPALVRLNVCVLKVFMSNKYDDMMRIKHELNNNMLN